MTRTPALSLQETHLKVIIRGSKSKKTERKTSASVLSFELLFLGGLFPMVRSMKIKVYSAQRAVSVGLAQNDSDLLVQRDAVAKVRSASFICFDRFLHERFQ